MDGPLAGAKSGLVLILCIFLLLEYKQIGSSKNYFLKSGSVFYSIQRSFQQIVDNIMRQRLLNLIIFFYNSGFYDSFSWLRLLGAETYLGILSPTLLQEKAKRPNYVQKIITRLKWPIITLNGNFWH